MSVSPDTLVDGDYSRATPNGPARFSYPFLQNKDRVSAVFEQEFWQTVATYTPPDLSIRYSDGMPDFYLVAETEPENFAANIYRFVRTYARIPTPQVTYSTIPINKPSAASVGTSDASFRLGPTQAFISAGYVYGLYYFGNNEVYGPAATTTAVDSGSNVRVTWTGHGVAGTEKILARGNANYIFAAGEYTVINANTIDLLNVQIAGIGTPTTCAKKLRDYTAGLDRVRTRITTTFYLPGVTSGITSASDITIPDVALNDATLFALMIAHTSGYQTYDADPLGLWMGQISQQPVIEIDMANL